MSKAEKDAIESAFDTEVHWEYPEETRTGNLRSRVWIAREGHIENREEWGEYLNWMLENGERYHEVFYDRL